MQQEGGTSRDQWPLGLVSAWKDFSTPEMAFIDPTCGYSVDGFTNHKYEIFAITNLGGFLTLSTEATNTADRRHYDCRELMGETGGGGRIGEGGLCDVCQQWLVYDLTTGTFLYSYWECDEGVPCEEAVV